MSTILATADRIEHFLEVLACEAFFSFAALNVSLFNDAEVEIPSCSKALEKGRLGAGE